MAIKARPVENAGLSIDLEVLFVKAGLNPKAYVTSPKWTSHRLDPCRAHQNQAPGWCFEATITPTEPNCQAGSADLSLAIRCRIRAQRGFGPVCTNAIAYSQ
jgi:hypothetical protein